VAFEMINESLLELLRCPQDGSRLTLASTPLIGELNQQIGAGTLRNVGGAVLKATLDGGLVREAGDLLYPIMDDIPVMLADEAIVLAATTFSTNGDS
jgi:uncharacterized protein YbaR (Trm112 family)